MTLITKGLPPQQVEENISAIHVHVEVIKYNAHIVMDVTMKLRSLC